MRNASRSLKDLRRSVNVYGVRCRGQRTDVSKLVMYFSIKVGCKKYEKCVEKIIIIHIHFKVNLNIININLL